MMLRYDHTDWHRAMYRLSATSNWYNGMRFDNLAEALKTARKAMGNFSTCDVVSVATGNTYIPIRPR